MPIRMPVKHFGIVGGLGALGAADVFFKLVKALPAKSGSEQAEILFEQHPFHETGNPGECGVSLNGRKIYIFDMIRSFEKRCVDSVLLPCFLSHTFLEEIVAETSIPIVNLMESLREHLSRRHPATRRLGILTSDLVRSKALFERYFPEKEWAIIYPKSEVQSLCLMPAIYGPEGIKAGYLKGESLDLLIRSCHDVLEQGVDVIVPGFCEIPVLIDTLQDQGFPIIDTNRIYAEYAAADACVRKEKPFKIGVVGGVGPAATVDFMSKIVRNSPASSDQEHPKLVVEQNPQIPDRTGNLIGDGADPTIALYSTCKKLEADEADIIAIPCNTAHAFVERIQPYLSIPIINMLFETASHIKRHHAGCRKIGLLATSGTIASRVYHQALETDGFELLVPDDENQKRVMSAIYGPKGVKAGFNQGQCAEELLEALISLAARGAEVIILGCTELPLLIEKNNTFPVPGGTVVILDPADILALKCVALSRGAD